MSNHTAGGSPGLAVPNHMPGNAAGCIKGSIVGGVAALGIKVADIKRAAAPTIVFITSSECVQRANAQEPSGFAPHLRGTFDLLFQLVTRHWTGLLPLR